MNEFPVRWRNELPTPFYGKQVQAFRRLDVKIERLDYFQVHGRCIDAEFFLHPSQGAVIPVTSLVIPGVS